MLVVLKVYMSDRVTIRTSSCKWSKETTLDDPTFSDLFAPFIELEEKPKEVILNGSVAEVFETQWSYYEALMEYRKRITCHDNSVVFEPHTMTRLLSGATMGSCAGFSSYRGLVYLHEIDTLSRIITMPDHWELCVAVDEKKSSPRDVDAYLARMGRAVLATDYSSYVPGLSDHVVVNTIWGIYDKVKSAKREVDPIVLIYAYLRNAALVTLSMDETPEAMSWHGVPWRSMRRVICEYAENNQDWHLINDTISMWLGEGRYTNVVIGQPLAGFVGYGIEANHMTFLPRLYDRLFNSFPDDVEPRLIGLSPITGEGGTDEFLCISSAAIVPQINYHTLMCPQWIASRALTSERKECELEEEYYAMAIELMLVTTVGRPGLARISRSLLAWLARTVESRDSMTREQRRVAKFITMIERRLDIPDDEEETERVRLGGDYNRAVTMILAQASKPKRNRESIKTDYTWID